MVSRWKPIALMIVTFLLAVSVKNEFVFFLLGFEVMLWLASFFQLMYFADKVKLKAFLPQTAAFRGETFQVRAKLTNTSKLPMPQLQVRLAVRVYPEREELLLKGKIMLDGEEEGSLCFDMDSEHCNCLEIRPDQLILTDFLGILQRKCKVDKDDKYMLFVLPEILHKDKEIPESKGHFLSEDGDSTREGSMAVDASEIRTYRVGDPVKLMHWKLTARLNELMVRELMDATEQLTWLYLDLQERTGAEKVRKSPEKWDHFLETVAGVSASMLELGKRHVVVWVDSEHNTVVNNEVSDEDTLQEMLMQLLRADTYEMKDYSQLLKEIRSDETKGACIEIDLQGDFVRSEIPG